MNVASFLLSFAGDLRRHPGSEQDHILAAGHQRCICCRGGMHTDVSVAGRVQFVQPGSERGHKSPLFTTSIIYIGWLGSGSRMFFTDMPCCPIRGDKVLCGLSVDLSFREGTILHQWPLKNVVGASHADPWSDMKACYESQFWHQGPSVQSTSCSAPRASHPFSVPQGWYF